MSANHGVTHIRVSLSVPVVVKAIQENRPTIVASAVTPIDLEVNVFATTNKFAQTYWVKPSGKMSAHD